MSYPKPNIETVVLQLYVFLRDTQETPWVQKLPSSHIENVERAVRGLHHHTLAAFSESMANSKANGLSPYPIPWESCPETVRQLLDYIADLVRCSVLGDPVRWSPADLSKIFKDDYGSAMVCCRILSSRSPSDKMVHLWLITKTQHQTMLPGGVASENDKIEQYPGFESPHSEASTEESFYPTRHSRTSEDSILVSDDFPIEVGQPNVLDANEGAPEEAGELPERM